FSHEAVDRQAAGHGVPPGIFSPAGRGLPSPEWSSPVEVWREARPSVSVSRVRISAIEIIGRKRMNNSRRVKNRAIVPRNVVQAQTVGEYMPQDDGKKSRCRLVMTMT